MEIAAEADLPIQRVQDLLELIQDHVSLDTPIGDGESNVGDLLEDLHAPAPEQATSDVLRTSELRRALEQLKPRQRQVLELRFGLSGRPPCTLEEVGVALGVTRERVRQLESRALRELQLVAPSLRAYLRTE